MSPLAALACVPSGFSGFLFVAFFLVLNLLKWGAIAIAVVLPIIGLAWAIHRVTIGLRRWRFTSLRQAARRRPKLGPAACWAEGERPSGTAVDAKTRAALEALWLGDAQREHSAVASTARVSMLLTAAGAPVELVLAMHRAGAAKVMHAQSCFALAAGYGRRTHPLEARPELLPAQGARRVSVLAELTTELLHTCLLADFRADEANAAAAECEEPIAFATLGRVAREERTRAELAWRALQWLAARDRRQMLPALRGARWNVRTVARPRRTTSEQALSKASNAGALRRAGRISEGECQSLWVARVRSTLARSRRPEATA